MGPAGRVDERVSHRSSLGTVDIDRRSTACGEPGPLMEVEDGLGRAVEDGAHEFARPGCDAVEPGGATAVVPAPVVEGGDVHRARRVADVEHPLALSTAGAGVVRAQIEEGNAVTEGEVQRPSAREAAGENRGSEHATAHDTTHVVDRQGAYAACRKVIGTALLPDRDALAPALSQTRELELRTGRDRDIPDLDFAGLSGARGQELIHPVDQAHGLPPAEGPQVDAGTVSGFADGRHSL